MTEVTQLTMVALEAGLETIRQSPVNNGSLDMIVRRPKIGEREVIEQGELDLVEGLVGDNWKARGSSGTKDGSAHPEMQITMMNSRLIALIALNKKRWQLAGDQLYIDMNLSEDNLPAGTQIALGSAVVQITPVPHRGCKLFVERFGVDATKFVNSQEGRELRLRGVNAIIVQPGAIRVGDLATIVEE